MENMQEKKIPARRWKTFDDDENLHPNPFVYHANSVRNSIIKPFFRRYAESTTRTTIHSPTN